MKSIALIKSNVVVNVCAWDGLAVWQPLNQGLADTTVDVSGTAVGPTWTWSLGSLTFTAPAGGATVVVASTAVNVTQ